MEITYDKYKKCERCHGKIHAGKYCGTCNMEMMKEEGRGYSDITGKYFKVEEQGK